MKNNFQNSTNMKIIQIQMFEIRKISQTETLVMYLAINKKNKLLIKKHFYHLFNDV